MWGRRSLQSRQAGAKRRRRDRVSSRSMPRSSIALVPVVVNSVVARISCQRREPAERAETIVKGYADSAGEVIVAGARDAEAVWRVRHKLAGSASGEDIQSFKHMRNVGSVKAVVAVFSLYKDFDEMRRGEAPQMGAGCGWSDAGDHGELGAGAGVAVQETGEDARSCRLADGSGDHRDRRYQCVYIHTSTLDEVSLSRNWHSDSK